MAKTHQIKSQWKGGMAFSTQLDGHTVTLDASEDNDGNNTGPRPKAMMLIALAGCTGMDVASLFKKMRVEVDDLDIDIEANVTEEHPQYYNKVHIKYYVSGTDIDKDKAQKAIDLSQEKYCGVSEMFRQFSTLTYEIIYN